MHFFQTPGIEWLEGEAKRNDEHQCGTRCFATSESDGSSLPCVAAKNISAVQSKRFSMCV